MKPNSSAGVEGNIRRGISICRGGFGQGGQRMIIRRGRDALVKGEPEAVCHRIIIFFLLNLQILILVACVCVWLKFKSLGMNTESVQLEGGSGRPRPSIKGPAAKHFTAQTD